MTNDNRSRFSRRSFLAGLGAAAAGVKFAPGMALAAEPKELNFYNWDTYIGENTLDDFRKSTGISVTMDLFADNDELFAKLKGGNPGYDVIVPTNDFVERMITAGMLEPLDLKNIPNIDNIDPTFRDAAFDPGSKYSLPYLWGTIGIGYRKSKVEGVPDSWKWLFDSDRYAGKIALMGDAPTLIQMGMKFLGYPLNDTNPAHIKQVEEMLIRQKPNVLVFAEDNGQDLLLSGEVDVVMEWNGDILQVMEEDDDIGYVVPMQGGLLWQDCLCIPTGAPHPENAHAFINYILDAEAGAQIADFIQYATPNTAARKLLPAEYNSNPAIFPSQETIERCEVATYNGPEYTRMIDEAYTRIMAS
ncbi:MAG: spermidine/putrescine ABC transporter substrate-binding protein [Gammaproteobacteria bacterium]